MIASHRSIEANVVCIKRERGVGVGRRSQSGMCVFEETLLLVRNALVDVVDASGVESDGVQSKLNVSNIYERVRLGNFYHHP